MGVEPGEAAVDDVALVIGFGEHVAFVFVEDEWGLVVRFGCDLRNEFGTTARETSRISTAPVTDRDYIARVTRIDGGRLAGVEAGWEAVDGMELRQGRAQALRVHGRVEWGREW